MNFAQLFVTVLLAAVFYMTIRLALKS